MPETLEIKITDDGGSGPQNYAMPPGDAHLPLPAPFGFNTRPETYKASDLPAAEHPADAMSRLATELNIPEWRAAIEDFRRGSMELIQFAQQRVPVPGHAGTESIGGAVTSPDDPGYDVIATEAPEPAAAAPLFPPIYKSAPAPTFPPLFAPATAPAQAGPLVVPPSAGSLAAPAAAGAASGAGLAGLAAAAGPAAIAVIGAQQAIHGLTDEVRQMYGAAHSFVQSINKDVDELAGFSSDLAASQANDDIRQMMAQMRRADSIGPEEARFNDAESRALASIYDAITELKGIILPVAVPIMQSVAIVAEGTVELIKLAESFFEAIDSKLEALGIDVTGMHGALTRVKDALKLWEQEKDDEKGAWNDPFNKAILGQLGQDVFGPVNRRLAPPKAAAVLK